MKTWRQALDDFDEETQDMVAELLASRDRSRRLIEAMTRGGRVSGVQGDPTYVEAAPTGYCLVCRFTWPMTDTMISCPRCTP